MAQTTTSLIINPLDLFDRVGLSAGMHVADFGAGRTGHLIFPAAKVVGEHGIVYAIDILPEVLTEITKRAAQNSFLQVKPVWADFEKSNGVSVPRQSLDLVFLVNILHAASSAEIVLNEAMRLLKDKGRLVVVDWVKSLGPIGPQSTNILDFEAVIAWARQQNFAVQADFPISAYARTLILFKHD